MTAGQTEGRTVRAGNRLGPTELEQLRAKINDRDYLFDAIECLAMILSNEILNIPQGGAYSEWEGGK
ncbi:MAG: hypothetical protein LBD29_10900 [Treponema sp.]|jgi:hypothetical protein|nr:hypothetical protein [Treponema sp.]